MCQWRLNLDKSYEELEILLEDEDLKNKITSHIIDYWRYLNIQIYCNKDDAIKSFINDEKTKVDFVDRIEKEIFKLKGKSVLDVGCGIGGVLVSCALRGAKVAGFDLGENDIKIAKSRVKSYDIDDVSIFKGNAENIPFPDNSFDIVVATSVLEHVKDLKKGIKEMIRVTKHDGFFCTTFPSPTFPREAHYKVFFIPYLPKSFSKLYLRLRGFNPDFFMKFITYPYPSVSKIERIFRENGMKVQNITERNILLKFKDPTSIENKRIRSAVNIFKKLRLNNYIVKLIIQFDFYPSVYLIARKRDTK